MDEGDRHQHLPDLFFTHLCHISHCPRPVLEMKDGCLSQIIHCDQIDCPLARINRILLVKQTLLVLFLLDGALALLAVHGDLFVLDASMNLHDEGLRRLHMLGQSALDDVQHSVVI